MSHAKGVDKAFNTSGGSLSPSAGGGTFGSATLGTQRVHKNEGTGRPGMTRDQVHKAGTQGAGPWVRTEKQRI